MAAAQSETARAGASTESPTYMRQQFGIPESESDCDKPQSLITDNMSANERQMATTLNASAREVCRANWSMRQQELTQSKLQQALSEMTRVGSIPSQPSPSDDKLAQDSRQLVEQSIAANARKHDVEACEERFVEDLKVSVAKGDTARAMIIQDAIRRDVCQTGASDTSAPNPTEGAESPSELAAQDTSPLPASPALPSPVGQIDQSSIWLGGLIAGLSAVVIAAAIVVRRRRNQA